MIDLQKFSDTKVLIVGDVILDAYWFGSTARVSPEAPVPIVQVDQQYSRVGGAGNVATNVSGLGAQAHLLGLVGDDEEASQLENMLAENNVVASLQKLRDHRTITKLRILSRNQQMVRLDREDLFLNSPYDTLLQSFDQIAETVDLVIMSDYAKGTLRTIEDLIARARTRKLPIVVDPKGHDFERYSGATILTPNLTEFEIVVGKCSTEDQLVERAERLRKELNLLALLITRGEHGMSLIAEGEDALHIPSEPREVFDVTGAGDTVAAVLGTSIAAGLELADAVRLSNTAAGIVVSKLGVANVTMTELGDAIRKSQGTSETRICTTKEAIDLRAQARVANQTVVMTNGCFDLLHPGHIDYLERAKAMGDKLFVAVNSDASVRRIKESANNGPRPINPLSHRLRVLAALSCVDCVISFEEDTPANIIGKILPDILVKGGDYKIENIAGREHVYNSGGKVQTLPFLPDYSTTNIISKIKMRYNT